MVESASRIDAHRQQHPTITSPRNEYSHQDHNSGTKSSAHAQALSAPAGPASYISGNASVSCSNGLAPCYTSHGGGSRFFPRGLLPLGQNDINGFSARLRQSRAARVLHCRLDRPALNPATTHLQCTPTHVHAFPSDRVTTYLPWISSVKCLDKFHPQGNPILSKMYSQLPHQTCPLHSIHPALFTG